MFGSRAREKARADSDLDLAVNVRQPQLTPAEKLVCWQRFQRACSGWVWASTKWCRGPLMRSD
jgi:hypothetical protein